jgi:putative heme-binding domain-containing protein
VTADQRLAIERALAEIHGSNGTLLAWHVEGPVPPKTAAGLVEKLTSGRALLVGKELAVRWRLVLGSGIDARVRAGTAVSEENVWLNYSEIEVNDSAKVEFFTASTGLATIWLNGKVVYQRDRPGVIGPYPDRFEATLEKGRNAVLLQLAGVKGPAEFQVRFRRKSATAVQERFALAALSRAGNPARGREVFLNAEKSLCIKCHRVGDQGERIGPELTGLGSRFAKMHIVESILEPSRSISPSFETVVVALRSGKVVTGVKIAEGDTSITVADNQGQKQVIAKGDIEEQKKQAVSTMPDGVEKRLTEDEFVDLISFLVNLRETRTP